MNICPHCAMILEFDMTAKTTYECPYCSNRLKYAWSECCHESGHAVRVDPENEADAEYDRMKEAEDE